jgi:hypothetical protein
MPHKRKTKRWIQKLHVKKGALHKQLGVPINESIPIGLLKEASHKSGKLGRRARLALTLRGFKSKKNSRYS